MLCTWLGGACAQEKTKKLPAAALESEDLQRQPGLLGAYRYIRTASQQPVLVRIDAKPAFTLTAGSIHPRLKPGAFEITWSGIIELQEEDQIRFGAFVRGGVQVFIGGVTVLRAQGESATQWTESPTSIECSPGLYPIRIVYQSPADPPARLQIWWEGETFSREPLPASRLWQGLPAATLDIEQLRESGRIAAQKFGCARCHKTAFPSPADHRPGPALTDLPNKITKRWLLQWLADPVKLRAGAHMPALFADDRNGFVERDIVADFLLQGAGLNKPDSGKPADADKGRRSFISLGCMACHLPPDQPSTLLPADRIPLIDLSHRTTQAHLARFLREPHTRFPDGRMPNFKLSSQEAANIAGYLLKHSRPTVLDEKETPSPRADEIQRVLRRLGVGSIMAAGKRLIAEKSCADCHDGLGPGRDIAIQLVNKSSWTEKGCLSGQTWPRFPLTANTRRSLKAFLEVAAQEHHPSDFEARRRLLVRLGCQQCHQRDSKQRPPIERVATTVFFKSKHFIYQRTPSLTGALTKYRLKHLRSAINSGVSGSRPSWYSYRMPAFAAQEAEIVTALAEADGDYLPSLDDPPPPKIDPNANSDGQVLVGFQGYSCVSCHVWKGDTLRVVEPSSAGPELTTVARRIRREWFDRWLESPQRIHPQTPMPAIFRKGKPALLRGVLDGDPTKQKDSLWMYLSRGEDAPDPRPKPPFPLPAPARGQPVEVAQIPLRTPDQQLVESICLLNDHHDLVLYDIGQMAIRAVYIGARLECKDGYHRGKPGYYRDLSIVGSKVPPKTFTQTQYQLVVGQNTEEATDKKFVGYDRLDDGMRIRARYKFPTGAVELAETIKIDRRRNQLTRRLQFSSIPKECRLQITRATDQKPTVRLDPNPKSRQVVAFHRDHLPPAAEPPNSHLAESDEAMVEIGEEFFEQDRSRLKRPGYRAIRYPRPKTAAGEDLVMPFAMTCDPKTGRLFVASNKFGELFTLEDPTGDGRRAQFIDYTRGRFQDIYGLHHDGQALYVLHRRNLTKVLDTDNDGRADRFDRVAPIAHAIAEQYDWAYGLAPDRQGRFIVSVPAFGDAGQKGAGGVLRQSHQGSDKFEEIAFGLRNPFGWCAGPNGDIFFTDNQGNWVQTNKLCHLQEGRFYGFVNNERPETSRRQQAPTALWIPYSWGQSINGVAFDNTQGKFGPFAGQFFLAELMRGGAIIRASLEKVNGVYQGACFPFWGKGLMGPLALCFDRRGSLYVGSITEPGWMSQPDRGGLFRINFTGQFPFEIQTIRVLPQGFRLKFTSVVDAKRAANTASYRIEHYRYRYSSDYGSPELDRTRLSIHQARLKVDGRTVDLETGRLETGRIYAITAAGVLSRQGESLVHDTGAYTLNQLPAGGKTQTGAR